MKTFEQYRQVLREGEADTADELVEALDNTLKKMFPESYVNVKFESSVVPAIEITFADMENLDPKRPGGTIKRNAPYYSQFLIGNDQIKVEKLENQFNKDGTMNGAKLTAERIQGPRSIKFRKRTSTPEKVYSAIIEYFERVKKDMR